MKKTEHNKVHKPARASRVKLTSQESAKRMQQFNNRKDRFIATVRAS